MDEGADQLVERILDRARLVRLPRLFRDKRQEEFYRVADRQGVTTVALTTRRLHKEELLELLRYRLAQYLLVGFIDPAAVHKDKMEHEPLDAVKPDDIHVIVGDPSSGEVVCYVTLRGAGQADNSVTLRTEERPLFPVEETHGWGVFNRLTSLPDMQINRIREVGRFVKNQQIPAMDERSIRAPIEALIAITRLVSGDFPDPVEALIGELEETVVKKNLDFFFFPTVTIHGTVAYADESSILTSAHSQRSFYPFAGTTADIGDIMLARVAAIEDALQLPTAEALPRLGQLKKIPIPMKSSLEPPGGLSPLTTEDVPQAKADMKARKHLLSIGHRLRAMTGFDTLSVSEAAVLGSFLERLEFSKGSVIVRQNEPADALFLIEEGEAEVRIWTNTDTWVPIRSMGPGDYFGEIALLKGVLRTANVVALSAMVLFRLGRVHFERYLPGAPEVLRKIVQTADQRLNDSLGIAPSGEMTSKGDGE